MEYKFNTQCTGLQAVLLLFLLLPTFSLLQKYSTLPASIAQSVMCWGPGVTSSIRARSHTFVEFDNEIISTVIFLPSADSRRLVVTYKQKYVHKSKYWLIT